MELLCVMLNHVTFVSLVTLLILITGVLLYFSIPNTSSSDAFVQILNALPLEVSLEADGKNSLANTDNIQKVDLGLRTEFSSYIVNRVDRRILIVVAHPDDETMFFSPTINELAKLGCKSHFDEACPLGRPVASGTKLFFCRSFPSISVYMLCMSTGNAHGLGSKRSRELVRAARVFGLKPENIVIVDHPGLQDDFDSTWDTGLVQRMVGQYAKKWKIDVILTFDEFGVSGHPCHSAVYWGVRKHLERNPRIKGYSLLSCSLLLKYASWCSIVFFPLVSFNTHFSFFNTPFQYYFISIKAMRQHQSQLVWYRWLYLLFSSYMVYNSFVEIKVSSPHPVPDRV